MTSVQAVGGASSAEHLIGTGKHPNRWPRRAEDRARPAAHHDGRMDGHGGPTTRGSKDGENERSVGRIFGLTDAVFAIAMTLLVLDLKVPDAGPHPTDSVLRAALWVQNPSYLAFLLSFYVTANYWRRHHRLMRTVLASDSALLGRTILLLLAISTMPFASALLGKYSDAIAITVYALVNALALAALLLIDHELAARKLSTDGKASGTASEMWFDLGAFLLAAPTAYLITGHGLVALVGLVLISGTVGRLVRRRLAKRAVADEPVEPISPPTPHPARSTPGLTQDQRRRFRSGSLGIDPPRLHRY